MGEAIAGVLGPAVGVALSPIPIIAVILMLGTPRAKVNGPAFLLGWVLGSVVVGGLVLVFAGGADTSGSTSSDAVSWLRVVVGVLLLVGAARRWRGRPEPGEQEPLPKWMKAIDSFTPVRALVFGALLSGVNPKNLALTAAAAASIAQSGASTTESVVALAVFVVVAALGVGIPVVVYLAMGARSEQLLVSWKAWMGQNNAAIMVVLFVVFGAVLIGNGMSSLTAS